MMTWLPRIAVGILILILVVLGFLGITKGELTLPGGRQLEGDQAKKAGIGFIVGAVVAALAAWFFLFKE